MIIAEQITINDRQFTKTYSDSGYMIERDGAQYSEAIDPIEFASERIYTETGIPIEGEGKSDTEQKAETDLTVKDTLEMLGELGVDTDD